MTLPTTYSGTWCVAREANLYSSSTDARGWRTSCVLKVGFNQIKYWSDSTDYTFICIGY